jgi:protein Mpv17
VKEAARKNQQRVCLRSGKYLLVTNTLSCGLMMGTGDVIQQRSDFLKRHMTMTSESPSSEPPSSNRTTPGEEAVGNRPEEETESTSESYDYARTRNMTVIGLIQGPFHHYFYNMLEKQLPGKSAGSICKKTLIDQTIASPVCLGMFFVGLGVLERKSLHEIECEIKLKLMNTWKVGLAGQAPTRAGT